MLFFGGGVLSFWDIQVCTLSGVILRRQRYIRFNEIRKTSVAHMARIGPN